MIFATHLNAHGIVACIGIGWSAMVTGQSLVLWSRLHLLYRNAFNLRLILLMIIFNGITMHGVQFVFSLLVSPHTTLVMPNSSKPQAVKNNAIDPTYKPFEILEKVSVTILTTQELIISLVYLIAATRLLRIGKSVHRKGNDRRIKMLFLANVAIICIDICTMTLEYMALWGIWCSFKGFGYSVKLKIEFAILNQLRDSVKSSEDGGSYDMHTLSSKGMRLSSRSRSEQNAKSAEKQGPRRRAFEQIADFGKIQKTTKIEIRNDEESKSQHENQIRAGDPCSPRAGGDMVPSVSSSEIELAGRGA